MWKAKTLFQKKMVGAWGKRYSLIDLIKIDIASKNGKKRFFPWKTLCVCKKRAWNVKTFSLRPLNQGSVQPEKFRAGKYVWQCCIFLFTRIIFRSDIFSLSLDIAWCLLPGACSNRRNHQNRWKSSYVLRFKSHYFLRWHDTMIKMI